MAGQSAWVASRMVAMGVGYAESRCLGQELMSERASRIAIVGGGFGGLYAALQLSQLPWDTVAPPEIVLIDCRDRFLFAPLLYELVTGELQAWEIAPPFEEVLAGTGIRFIQARATGIDTGSKQIQLADRAPLSYDTLILGVGGETPMEAVPGAAEHAIPFRRLADAHRLQQQLRALEHSDCDRIRVAVVGGGYSGVELACKVADRLGERGRLRLIERGDAILKRSAPFNREAAQRALEAKQIWIDRETTVASVGADSIELVYKGQTDTLPVELVLWTIGLSASSLLAELPFPQNERGQLQVAPTLQAAEGSAVFAVGDAIECRDAEGAQVPPTAQAAYQQADYCAWNVWASLTGRPLLPFRYQHLGEMMALGTDNATLTSGRLQLEGLGAYTARRLAYLARMPTLNHKLTVGGNWIARPLLAALAR